MSELRWLRRLKKLELKKPNLTDVRVLGKKTNPRCYGMQLTETMLSDEKRKCFSSSSNY